MSVENKIFLLLSRPFLHKSSRLTAQPWQQNLRYYADYPDHIKVTLPALSPTMETGTIISWQKKEGILWFISILDIFKVYQSPKYSQFRMSVTNILMFRSI